MTSAANPPRASGQVTRPQQWCSPPEAFGHLDVQERVWLPPRGHDLTEVAKFRAAVMQNVICLHVRKHKNLTQHGRDGSKVMTQEQLAALDPRPDTQRRWNARLCGRANLTTADIATLLMILPDAMPSEQEIRMFIDVAEKRVVPSGWFKDDWPDT